jgi:hypothetical protein
MYCTQIAKEAILSVLPEYIARGFMKSALLNITFFAVQQVFCYTGFIRLVIISYSPSSVPSRTYNSTKSAIEIELTICGTEVSHTAFITGKRIQVPRACEDFA